VKIEISLRGTGKSLRTSPHHSFANQQQNAQQCLEDLDQGATSLATGKVYQRRWLDCCIMPGEIDDGGLMRVRVSGFTMGIGLRDRMAEG